MYTYIYVCMCVCDLGATETVGPARLCQAFTHFSKLRFLNLGSLTPNIILLDSMFIFEYVLGHSTYSGTRKIDHFGEGDGRSRFKPLRVRQIEKSPSSPAASKAPRQKSLYRSRGRQTKEKNTSNNNQTFVLSSVSIIYLQLRALL